MSHVNGVSVVVSGKIKILINKKWKQRFCVVARTAFAATVKLFIYKETSDYKTSIDLSVQTPHDTIYGLDSVSNSDKSPVIAAIVLTCEDRLVLLGFNNYNDLTFWVEKIGDSIQDASYRAKFLKCESIGKPIQQQLSSSGADGSSGGSGDGRLHVQPSRLCFYSEPAESHRSLSVWPLESVKRYMVNEAMGCFVFEGDVGCGKLRGMHYFQCEKRHQLYLDMKAACVNKPMPSLAQRRIAESFAVHDPLRPAASSSIDIPKPRLKQHLPEPPVQLRSQPDPRCRHRCQHRCTSSRRREQLPLCRCACHGRVAKDIDDAQTDQQLPADQQQKSRLQLPPWTADSGYGGGGGSAAYFNLCVLPRPVLSMPQQQQHRQSAAIGSGCRDYCNLPAGSAPSSAGIVKLKSATLTAPPGRLATDSPGLLSGIVRSFTWRRRQNSQQPYQPDLEVAGRSRRLVRSSSDLCDSRSGLQFVVGTANSGADCCSCTCCCCCNCRDLDDDCCDDDGVCGSSSCGSSAGGGGAGSFWTAALPVAASAASAATDVRMRKPRHGFEYVSRQRVVSLSSSSSGCYANLPALPQFPPALSDRIGGMRLTEEPESSVEPPCRSAPPASAAGDTPLLYATLDHGSTTSPPPALATATSAAQRPQLNYTEVDHDKTSAFREIAEQLGGSQKPQPQQSHWPARSNSTAGSTATSGTSRRSFIRIFQRGHSFRHD